MKPNSLNINALLLHPVPVPLPAAEDKKTTIRTSAEQTAFIQAVQAALPGNLSFNDALNAIVDTVSHFSQHPYPELPVGHARILALFAQHGIPGIHINRILEHLGLPKASPVELSSPDKFVALFDEKQAESIADFFAVSIDYITGQAQSPYVVPIITHEKELDAVQRCIQKQDKVLQPHFSLCSYSCHEQGIDESILYLKTERSLDARFVFNTYKCIGRFLSDEGSDLIKALVDSLGQYHCRFFGLESSLNELEKLRQGYFIN